MVKISADSAELRRWRVVDGFYLRRGFRSLVGVSAALRRCGDVSAVLRVRVDVITASARQSATLIERLAATVDPIAIEQFAEDVDRLAVDYIASPPAEVARDAKDLRDSIAVALERTRRPSQIQDLYRLAARTSGILAYAALDIGHASAAMSNARSALMCADLAEDQLLCAWVHGTKSLIARFAQRYEDAERYLRDGMRLAPRGHSLARLASGQAQCRAHFGDIVGAREALQAAMKAHSNAGEPRDGDIGLFGFPRSKVHYYAASSLIWLPNGTGAHEAATQAATAIQLFRTGPTTERFITDEVLTHIYGATAYLQQGDIEAAERMLKAIFDTPPDQRVSWHRHRLARITQVLQSPKFRTARKAGELQAAIAAF